MTLSEKLAKNLKSRRGKLSQDAFARKLGMSRATLTRLENVGQNTTLKTLNKISKSLRYDVGDLFSDPTKKQS
jgi:transcriptional regulator with XRE-family HTH domain